MFINEEQQEEKLESENRKRSAIVITFENKAEVLKLCTKKLRFRIASKVVEKYWEAKPSLLYITCLGICHDQPEECVERPV